MANTAFSAPGIWNPSQDLPVRIKKLRDEYFDFFLSYSKCEL